MKFKLLLISTMLISSSIMAEETSLRISTTTFKEDIAPAYEMELKYEADEGGYAFMEFGYQKDKIFNQIKIENISGLFGIGVKEPWKIKVFKADFYADIGFFYSNTEIKDILTNQKEKFSENGLHYRIGAEFHPFSDYFDIITELRHVPSPKIGKDTLLSVGLAYQINSIKSSITYDDQNSIKLSIVFLF